MLYLFRKKCLLLAKFSFDSLNLHRSEITINRRTCDLRPFIVASLTPQTPNKKGLQQWTDYDGNTNHSKFTPIYASSYPIIITVLIGSY